MQKKIIIVGSGGHAISCVEIIKNTNKFEIVGYVDKYENKNFFDLEYLGTDDYFINNYDKSIYVFLAIGQIKDSKIRSDLYQKYYNSGFELPSIISNTAIVSNYSQILSGSIIMNNVIIGGYSKIGENCIINNNSLIEHNCVIGNNSHISTGVIINGNCVIGKNSFIGSNSTVNNNVKIEDFSIVPSHSRIAKWLIKKQ